LRVGGASIATVALCAPLLVVAFRETTSSAAIGHAVPSFDYYAGLVRAAGGIVNRDGRATVLSLRGRSVDGTAHDVVVTDADDDTFVVLSPDHTVTTLSGSTHPWQIDDNYPLDVDHDGRPDVGMVKPGRYLVVSQGIDVAGAPSYYVYTEDGDYHLPAWENTDHDDRYSDEEKAASDERGDTVTDVLFHSQGPGAPVSIGCQVLSEESMVELADLVGESFDYILVDAPVDLFGSIDVATTTADGNARLSGWALDLRFDGPVTVHAYVDGRLTSVVSADRARTDVAHVFAAFGVADGHGFTIDTKPGHICLYLIDVIAGSNPLLGCRDVGVRPPIGSFDVLERNAQDIHLEGWSFDPDTPTVGVALHVYVDNVLSAGLVADRARTDVGGVYPRAGSNHGFDAILAVAPGRHQVCVYAINTGPGGNEMIGCKTVTS
jgi:hypothetical protein